MASMLARAAAQLTHLGCVVKCEKMCDLLNLLFDGFHDFRMTVSRVDDGDARISAVVPLLPRLQPSSLCWLSFSQQVGCSPVDLP